MEENLNFWKEFDVVALKTYVHGFTEEIRKQKERSLKSRKELATATKEFRTLSVEEKLKSLGSVLKKYQKEIDALTKRSRKAEKMYVTSFKDIAKAPGDVSEIVTAYRRLREEFSSLKNQDITVRKLENEVSRLKSKMETSVALRVETLKSEIESSRDERESELLSRIEDAERLRNESAMKFDELQNRLFELQGKIDDEDLKSSSSNNNDDAIVYETSEEIKRRVQLLELENQKLVERVVKAERSNSNEKLISNLQESVRSEQNRTSALQIKVTALESKLENSQRELSESKEELKSRPSAESIKVLRKKLDAFRTIEYGDVEEDVELESTWFRDLVNRKVRVLQKENAELRQKEKSATSELEKVRSVFECEA